MSADESSKKANNEFGLVDLASRELEGAPGSENSEGASTFNAIEEEIAEELAFKSNVSTVLSYNKAATPSAHRLGTPIHGGSRAETSRELHELGIEDKENGFSVVFSRTPYDFGILKENGVGILVSEETEHYLEATHTMEDQFPEVQEKRETREGYLVAIGKNYRPE